jgi:hypothetical protein
MPIENQNFKYPLTCCPMSNTDSIVFNRILSCAINGSDIYEIVCQDYSDIRKYFFFEYLELLSEDVRYGSFNEEYYIDYHYIYPSY